jgi:hypothetical protein
MPTPIFSASAISPRWMLNACLRSACENSVESPTKVKSFTRYCFPALMVSSRATSGILRVHGRLKRMNLWRHLCLQIAPMPQAVADS